MRLSYPKAVLFDWDNTLVNTWPVIHAALHHTFKEMLLQPWSLDEVKMKVRHSMRDSFPLVFGEKWEKAGKIYQDYYLKTHLEKLEPLPQAEETLRFLKEKNIYTAVVSNKRGHSLRLESSHIGWDSLFDTVVGADDAQRDKPYCDPVELALLPSGVEAGPDVWFIGDSEIDLECARITNCSPILFGEPLTEHHKAEEQLLCDFPYLVHVKNHDELIQLMKEVL